MSAALDHLRARFEPTPRELQEDELVRIARGDRGCLGDLVSGVGAAALVTSAILGAMGKISFNWTYGAAALWIGGFVWGTISQTRSGKLRRAALEEGPLVQAVVLRSEAWLRRPGKRVGRAVVVFSTAPSRRFDRDWLDTVAAAVESSAKTRAWAQLLTDPDAFGVVGLEPKDEAFAGLEDAEGLEQTYVAAMHVHPERLEGNYLGYAEDQDAAEAGLDLDAPTRAPTVVAIVDPERAFIEQVPQVAGVLPEADDDADGEQG